MMTPQAGYKWGVSDAADRVWAEVSGLAPSLASGRIFLVLQAFIDDSADQDSGVFALGGCIATAESWAQFSKEWERLLPMAKLGKSGVWRFKMKEMATKGSIDKVPLFFRVIEDHVIGFLSASINTHDLKRAIARVHISPNVEINWRKYDKPWFVAFRVLMDKFHEERASLNRILGEDEKIDFYFDDGVDKKTVIETWDDYLKSRPDEIKKFYGSTPSFRDDEKFLPLQAADFWAWWVRKWTIEGVIDARLADFDFGSFRPTWRKFPLRAHITLGGEDEIVGLLKEGIRALLPKDYPYQIWDMKLD